MKKINSYFLITRKKIPAYLKYYWSKITSGIKTKVEGIPPLILLKSLGKNLINYLIYGNSVQDGTPTPDVPIEIESVGDLITDTNDVNYGKYKIPVVARGKNLFDKENMSVTGTYTNVFITNNNGNLTFNGTSSGYGTFYLWEGILEAGSYVISSNNYGSTNYSNNYLVLYVGTSKGAKDIKQVSYSSSISFVLNEKTYIYMCFKLYTNSIYNLEIENIQLETGTSTTPYEPYFIPTINNIYLDEPLRKVGNYADYIDYKNQKVFRNVIVNDDTGTDTIENSYTGTTDSSGTSISLPNIPTIKGTTIFEIDTEIQPSKIEVEYLRGG